MVDDPARTAFGTLSQNGERVLVDADETFSDVDTATTQKRMIAPTKIGLRHPGLITNVDALTFSESLSFQHQCCPPSYHFLVEVSSASTCPRIRVRKTALFNLMWQQYSPSNLRSGSRMINLHRDAMSLLRSSEMHLTSELRRLNRPGNSEGYRKPEPIHFVNGNYAPTPDFGKALFTKATAISDGVSAQIQRCRMRPRG